MTGWERPKDRSRSLPAVLVAGALVACVGLGVAFGLLRGEPGGLVVDERRPTATPSTAARPRWRRPPAGTWRRLPPSPLAPRIGHSIVGTDAGVFVWGGFDARGRPLTDGAVFSPTTGTWRGVPQTDVRDAGARAVWTGTDVVLVGADRVARWRPGARRWRRAPPLPVADGHQWIRPVLSAGGQAIAFTRSRARDAPVAVHALARRATAWRRLPDAPFPPSSAGATVDAQGRVVLIGPRRRGGLAVGTLDVAAPGAAWVQLPPAPGFLPDEAAPIQAAATDDALVLHALGVPDAPTAVARSGAWALLDPAEPPRFGRAVDSVWTGRELIWWDRERNGGAGLDIDRGRWRAVPTAPLPPAPPMPAVWARTGLVAWGGLGAGGAWYTPRG